MSKFSVAIDGPAGAGKSSIAKKIASILNCIYVDTGAMYRTVGYYCIKNNIDYNNEKQVEEICDRVKLKLKLEDGVQQIFLDEVNVSELIRTPEASMAASKVAMYKAVRESLVKKQQEIAANQSLVMDGRDIGTVVLPDATLKIFLVATVFERANRRYKEYLAKGQNPCFESLQKEIEDRDYQDSNREISPLKKADDAVEIDTTNMTIDEVIETIVSMLKEQL